MLSFKHPNVMSLVAVCFDGEMPLLIMPFMSYGSLLAHVKQNRERLHCAIETDDIQVKKCENPMCISLCTCIVLYVTFCDFRAVCVCVMYALFRLKQPEKPVWICVIRSPRVWLTSPNTSLFIVILLQETVCEYHSIHNMCSSSCVYC